MRIYSFEKPPGIFPKAKTPRNSTFFRRYCTFVTPLLLMMTHHEEKCGLMLYHSPKPNPRGCKRSAIAPFFQRHFFLVTALGNFTLFLTNPGNSTCYFFDTPENSIPPPPPPAPHVRIFSGIAIFGYSKKREL